MSIKYSGILAADEVTSAGDNDIIVLAIVDGGAPTGYTTKAIKKSNLITVGPPKAFIGLIGSFILMIIAAIMSWNIFPIHLIKESF